MAVSLVLVAVACGGTDDAVERPVDTPGPGTDVADGATVELRAPRPIEVVRSGGSGSSATAALGFDTRIVQQDGELLPVTEDFSETRVNVAVEGPRMVVIDSIG